MSAVSQDPFLVLFVSHLLLDIIRHLLLDRILDILCNVAHLNVPLISFFPFSLFAIQVTSHIRLMFEESVSPADCLFVTQFLNVENKKMI